MKAEQASDPINQLTGDVHDRAATKYTIPSDTSTQRNYKLYCVNLDIVDKVKKNVLQTLSNNLL